MAVGFLKFVCVWNLSYSARHGTLPEGRGHEQPPSPCELEVRVSPGGQLEFQDMSTRRQHFLMPTSGSWGKQRLRESRLLGCEI